MKIGDLYCSGNDFIVITDQENLIGVNQYNEIQKVQDTDLLVLSSEQIINVFKERICNQIK